MARHMMQRDMFHNDMAANHAAVSYYAGTSSVWGFYWYAYFSRFSIYLIIPAAPYFKTKGEENHDCNHFSGCHLRGVRRRRHDLRENKGYRIHAAGGLRRIPGRLLDRRFPHHPVC